MTKNSIPMTADGLEKLKAELEHLITVRRREVAQQIAEAKAEGDLRENAGYDEAKNTQAFVEGRIRELEAKIRNAQLINESSAPTDEVMLGRTVVVEEVGTDYKEEYMIVGSVEADPKNGLISNESPMGKALLSKKVGDVVTVSTPGGEIEFEILSVE